MTAPAPLRIDHVMMASVEPERDLAELRSLGLTVGAESVFEDGVKNWVIPMGSGQYLELLTADPDNESGEWIRACVEAGSRFAGWAVEVPSVDDVASRLGVPVSEGVAIKDQEGSTPWRTVDSPGGSFLPFFITYSWTSHRGTPDYERGLAAWLEQTAPGGVEAEGISSVKLRGDAARLTEWVGGDLPLEVQPGTPTGLIEVTVSTVRGEIVISDLVS